jgi:hypothetical protein
MCTGGEDDRSRTWIPDPRAAVPLDGGRACPPDDPRGGHDDPGGHRPEPPEHALHLSQEHGRGRAPPRPRAPRLPAPEPAAAPARGGAARAGADREAHAWGALRASPHRAGRGLCAGPGGRIPDRGARRDGTARARAAVGGAGGIRQDPSTGREGSRSRPLLRSMSAPPSITASFGATASFRACGRRCGRRAKGAPLAAAQRKHI